MCRFGVRCARKNPAHFEEENHPDDHPLFAPSDSAPHAQPHPACVYSPAPGKPMCRFGIQCTRKNPTHFEEENHPDDHPLFSQRPDVAGTTGAIGLKRNFTNMTEGLPKRLAVHARDSGASTLASEINPTESESAAVMPMTSRAPPSNISVHELTTPLPTEYTRDMWRPIMREAYLTPFDDDVFVLYELCVSLRPQEPLAALLAGGITPLAPFRLLTGEKSAASPLADRGLHDAAEFQPLLQVGPVSAGHVLGYWRDDPDEPPSFVVERRPLPTIPAPGVSHFGPGVSYTVVAENLLAACRKRLSEEAKSGTLHSREAARLAECVAAAAEGAGLSLDAEGESSQAAKTRKRAGLAGGKPGAKWVETSSKIGVVFPYDRENEIGYRRLHLMGKELRKLLARIVSSPDAERAQHQSELDELINWSNISNDESDFGASLQLGSDLLNHDLCFASAAAQQLTTAYSLLGRQPFAEIATQHAERRRQAATCRSS